MEISDLIGLKEPLTKLLEITEKAFGAVTKPFLMRMINKTKIKNAKDIEAFIKNSDLLVTYRNEEFEFINYNEEINNKTLLKDDKKEISILNNALNINERSQIRLNHVSIKKQNNLEEIISNAFENIINDEEVKNKKFEKNVDEDWLNNFFEYSENISNDDMQKLWGKILSDEIQKPNSYSLRTLDSLRKMTNEDALRFEKLSKIIMFRSIHAFIFSNRSFLSQYNLSFGDLILLEDIGLISTSERTITIPFNEQNKISINFTHKINFLVLECKVEKIIEIYKLTNIGYELAKLITCNVENDFIDKAGEYFKNKYKINNVTLANLVSYDSLNDSYNYLKIKTY